MAVRKKEPTDAEKIAELNEQELIDLVSKLVEENASLHKKLDVATFAFDKIPEPSEEYKMLSGGTRFPTAQEISELSYSGNGDGGETLLIEGDNLPSLISLHEVYKDKVNVVYIDPPYNTGNDFVYNDTRKGKGKKGNLFKHSAWLSFMERRLILAKDMMLDEGIILLSIDNNEYAHLKLLMDEIFGERNYIGTVTWQGAPSSLSKFTSGGVDYLLAYGKNITAASKWKVKKPYVDQMLLSISRAQKKTNNPEKLTAVLRAYIAKNRNKLGKGLTAYNKVDIEGRIYSDSSLTNSLYRPNLRYPLTDPSNGRVYNPPKNGWKLSEATMQKLLDRDLVLFEGRKYPRKKMLLSEYMYALPAQSFFASRTSGSSVLAKIVGKGKFQFPKNVEVIKEWISAVCDKPDALILDFFAGSGTTAHAVAELNKEDGGTRNCILMTSNENNIAIDVTQKRVERILTGENWEDGREHEELPGSLRYARIAWEEGIPDNEAIKKLRNLGLLEEQDSK